MVDLTRLLPHQPGLQHLQAAAARGRLARCLVFAGPEGTGRRTAALALAKWLHCAEKPGPISFCGQCRACRLIDEDGHPAVTRLRPPLFTRKDHPWLVDPRTGDKARADSLQISIVQARNMRADVAVPPAEGPCKVYILEGADAMQLEANDTLLKTLEEPPSYVYLCLIAASAAALRPTILSRARVIRFLPFPDERVASIVAAEVPEAAARAAEIAAYAGGSPGLALQLATDAALLALADEARLILADALTGDQLLALRGASRLHALAGQWFTLRYRPTALPEETADEESGEEEEAPEEPRGKRSRAPATGVRLGAIQLADTLANLLRGALRQETGGSTIVLPSAAGDCTSAPSLGIISEGRAALEANANLASCLSALLLRIAGGAAAPQPAAR